MKTAKVLLLLSVLCLGACTPSAKEVTYPVVPPALADCKIYELIDGTGGRLIAMRCPGSTTTVSYKQGKATRQVVVIDGQTFVKEEK